MISREYCRELSRAMRRSGLKTLEPEEMFQRLKRLEEYGEVTRGGVHRAVVKLDVPNLQLVGAHSLRLCHNTE